MKKIVYYTQIYFLDCDLPLIKQLRECGWEVHLFIEILPTRLKSTIVNIDRQINRNAILKGWEYEDFRKFSGYIDLDMTYIVNRVSKVYGLKNFKLRLSLYKLIAEIAPDVFHLTEFLDTYDCLLYSFRKKMVQVVHDPFPHVGENNLRREFFRRIGFWLVPKFVLLNITQKQSFMDVYGIKETQIYVNKLGVYDCLHLFKSDIDFHFGNGYVLFFGRISKYKGINVLLEAIKRLNSQGVNIKVIVAGSGKLPFDTLDYREMHYIKVVNRYVSMNELYSLLNKAKMVVCPYLEATQSGVVMTAYALRKPVVATDVGGLPEMVDDYKTGIIVPADNAEALAMGINSLLSNDDLYGSMVDNIIVKTENGDISWNKIAKNYIAFYNKKI